MFQRARIAIVEAYKRRLGQHSRTLFKPFTHIFCLLGIFLLIGILSSLSALSEAESAEVCHINLQGAAFDDIDDVEGIIDDIDDIDRITFNFNFLDFYSDYQNICMPNRA